MGRAHNDWGEEEAENMMKGEMRRANALKVSVWRVQGTRMVLWGEERRPLE